MGACSFENRGRGKSAQDVFRRLQERAEREYGDDCYNGTISTVPGFRDITNEWKNSKRDLDSFISKKLDDANKYDCFCICTNPPVENKNKTKSQVDHIVTPGAKKWVLRYVVRCGDHYVGGWPTKGEAVKDARRYTEANQASTTISMEKYLEKGSSTVAKITYKKSDKERDGQWIFFGYAAE
jgi:hypothetical protein